MLADFGLLNVFSGPITIDKTDKLFLNYWAPLYILQLYFHHDAESLDHFFCLFSKFKNTLWVLRSLLDFICTAFAP